MTMRNRHERRKAEKLGRIQKKLTEPEQVLNLLAEVMERCEDDELGLEALKIALALQWRQAREQTAIQPFLRAVRSTYEEVLRHTGVTPPHEPAEVLPVTPVLSSGIVFIHEDGNSFEYAPLQVFRGVDGGTNIRIGRNILHFNEDGSFDGNESKFTEQTDDATVKAINEAMQHQKRHRGRKPLETYYQAGSTGWETEIASWPSDADEVALDVDDAKSTVYNAGIVPPKVH